MHQSLWKDSKNIFFDKSDPNKMSQAFKHYLAGQLALLPEFAVLYAPTINSYKRLVEGMWAPTRATWGLDNRTCALRVIPGSKKSTRLETRISGADCNPYLSVAGALASGLWGLENKVELEAAPISGNAYENRSAPRIPSNLFEAAHRFSESKVARELFGDEFVDHYAKTRIWEWQQYQAAVTDWELKRYFEII